MSEFASYNANPVHKRVGDCTVRAISRALGQDWETTYIGLALQGFMLSDMPSANSVWGAYLRHKGFSRRTIPESCPDCYTVGDFADEHPHGTYIMALPGHVVCLQDGTIFDTWDSREETPLYFWERSSR